MDIYEAKVIVVGDAGVGKTNIITRFTGDKFTNRSNTTIGATHMSRVIEVDKKKISFSIWDTAGQERYRSLARLYYRHANFVILVYDISNRESFTQLTHWLQELAQERTNSPILCVVGNKSDLTGSSDSSVSPLEGQEFAQSVGALWFTASAKTGEGVTELFIALGQEYDPRRMTSTMTNSLILNCVAKPPRRRCC